MCMVHGSGRGNLKIGDTLSRLNLQSAKLPSHASRQEIAPLLKYYRRLAEYGTYGKGVAEGLTKMWLNNGHERPRMTGHSTL